MIFLGNLQKHGIKVWQQLLAQSSDSGQKLNRISKIGELNITKDWEQSQGRRLRSTLAK